MTALHKTLNLALLGYGYAGKTLHAPLIASVAGLHLSAVVSSDAKKVKADLPSVNVFASPDELLVQADINAIIIASPNHTHFALARQALLAGKHVVVDKPITVTATQAHELRDIAHERGLIISAFHNRRWDADFLTLRALIASGQLGELQSLESNFDRYRPEVRPRWREQAGEGTGLWYDLGPHLLDQALQLFGRPVSMEATFGMQRPNTQTVDYFHVLLRYENLQVTLHAGMMEQNETPRYVLKGRAGSYTKYGFDLQEAALKVGELPVDASWGLDPRNGLLRMHTSQNGAFRILPNISGDYRQFYSGFRDAILFDKANPVSPEDAVINMELIELACKCSVMGGVLN